MRKRGTHEVDFVIEEGDLPSLIEIDEEDLEAMDPPLVVVCSEDLAKVEQQILRIGSEDLPPIVKIGLSDLPTDLNQMTTECYHGTSRAAAHRIRKHGFRVGSGMARGAGVYFSVGGVSMAKGYTKGQPCIIRARIDWGKVAYLDDPKTPKSFKKGSGEARTRAALKLGYASFVSKSKFSTSSPAIGIVLGRKGSYIKPPRIEVMELIDPRSRRSNKA
jgi:hypothetical protein